jgi:asparagine synthase (glutamine-hydrolysing)
MRDAATFDELMKTFLDEWEGKASPVLPAGPNPREGALDMELGAGAPDVTRLMYCDAVSYLPDDILCKVDRAAMAVSLETRIPLLDHRVAAVAARIPPSMKIKGGTGKAILRQLLYRHAPKQLFERPKAGFSIPVSHWMKGPLKPWAEELLDPTRMRDDGFFDPTLVQERWRSHLKGERDSSQALWTVLMFQAWLDENRRDIEGTSHQVHPRAA